MMRCISSSTVQNGELVVHHKDNGIVIIINDLTDPSGSSQIVMSMREGEELREKLTKALETK